MNIQRLSRSHRRRIFGGYSAKVLGYGPIAYWPLDEASGSAALCHVNPAQNGAFTGVTLGQTGIGDGGTCPLFDGTNDFCNIYSTTLNSVLSKTKFSALAWFKVDSVAQWTDGGVRYVLCFVVDASNAIMMRKSSQNNYFRWYYKAGGTNKNVLKTGITETGWVFTGMTVDTVADQLKAYWFVDGVGGQVGATTTLLGTWAGDLQATYSHIGAYSTTPTNPWYGHLAHVALYNDVLTLADFTNLAVV
jgi:hypothetical protein